MLNLLLDIAKSSDPTTSDRLMKWISDHVRMFSTTKIMPRTELMFINKPHIINGAVEQEMSEELLTNVVQCIEESSEDTLLGERITKTIYVLKP